jgi:hypothetical protein
MFCGAPIGPNTNSPSGPSITSSRVFLHASCSFSANNGQLSQKSWKLSPTSLHPSMNTSNCFRNVRRMKSLGCVTPREKKRRKGDRTVQRGGSIPGRIRSHWAFQLDSPFRTATSVASWRASRTRICRSSILRVTSSCYVMLEYHQIRVLSALFLRRALTKSESHPSRFRSSSDISNVGHRGKACV